MINKEFLEKNAKQILLAIASKDFKQKDLTNFIGECGACEVLTLCDNLEEETVDSLVSTILENWDNQTPDTQSFSDMIVYQKCLKDKHLKDIRNKILEINDAWVAKKYLLNRSLQYAFDEEGRNNLAKIVAKSDNGSYIDDLLTSDIIQKNPFTQETTDLLVKKILELGNLRYVTRALGYCMFLTKNNKNNLLAFIKGSLPITSNTTKYAFMENPNLDAEERKLLLECSSKDTLKIILGFCENLSEAEIEYLIQRTKKFKGEETLEDRCFCEDYCKCGIR